MRQRQEAILAMAVRPALAESTPCTDRARSNRRGDSEVSRSRGIHLTGLPALQNARQGSLQVRPWSGITTWCPPLPCPVTRSRGSLGQTRSQASRHQNSFGAVRPTLWAASARARCRPVRRVRSQPGSGVPFARAMGIFPRWPMRQESAARWAVMHRVARVTRHGMPSSSVPSQPMHC